MNGFTKLANFDQQYISILQSIISDGVKEKNQRTGHFCHSLAGQTMRFDLAEGFPLLSLRRIPLKVFIAEQIWFLMGEKNISWLQEFTKIWNDFAEDNNCVEAAYGYRWRRYFGRDQIRALIKLLTQDPSSRHGVILMWDPTEDGLGSDKQKKNIPCPYTFTVQIIGNRLCLHLIIRSNDMMLGNPHDVSGFALQAYFLSQKLQVDPGILTISISNAHIYDIHLPQAKELCQRSVSSSAVILSLPEKAFDRAENGDRDLVGEIFSNLKQQYKPQEPVEKMPIVL